MVLILLDLNGTLVDSCHHRRVGMRRDPDCKARTKYLYFRPHLRPFLEYLFENFEVGVWTSHIRANAEAIVECVFTPEQRTLLKCVMCRENCYVDDNDPEHRSYKDMRNIEGWIIDNSPEKILGADEHLIRVPEFRAENEDTVENDHFLHELIWGRLRELTN
jgi:hypothetical protein